MYHGFLCPIRLEYVVAFFLRKVTFHNPFLVHIRYRIIGTYRSREIFERPIGRSCQPRHILLFFQVPVNQLYNICFTPISFFKHLCRTIQCCISITFTCFTNGCHHLGMASGMAVTSPLYVQEMFHLFHLSKRHLLIIGIISPIPARPDRRRININNITTEGTTANSRLATIIQLMREGVKFTHQRADLSLIKCFKIIRPVILVSESPDDHGRMIAVLFYHVCQHVFGL